MVKINENIKITKLDGTIQEQTAAAKELFGLRPDQSFQDLDVEPLNDDED